MATLPTPVSNAIPPATAVRATIGQLLRELQLARKLLRLANKVEQMRAADQAASHQGAADVRR